MLGEYRRFERFECEADGDGPRRKGHAEVPVRPGVVTVTTPTATATIKLDGCYVGTAIYWIQDDSVAYVIPGVTEEIRVAPNIAEANAAIEREISNKNRSGFAPKGDSRS